MPSLFFTQALGAPYSHVEGRHTSLAISSRNNSLLAGENHRCPAARGFASFVDEWNA